MNPFETYDVTDRHIQRQLIAPLFLRQGLRIKITNLTKGAIEGLIKWSYNPQQSLSIGLRILSSQVAN